MDNGGWLGMMAKMKKIIHRQPHRLLQEAQAVALLALGEEVAAKAAIAVPWHKIQMLVCVRAGEQGREVAAAIFGSSSIRRLVC